MESTYKSCPATAKELFIEAYETTERSWVFNTDWRNGTGYHDAAVTDKFPEIKEGEKVRSYDSERQVRVLLIGTYFGNVVIFERKSNSLDDRIVMNYPQALKAAGLLPEGGKLSVDGLHTLVGGWGELNIGEKVKYLYGAFKKHENFTTSFNKEPNHA